MSRPASADIPAPEGAKPEENKQVPPYINPSVFFHPNFSLEKGDIIVCSPPKCGTHFGMQMVYQMISAGDMSFESIYDQVHWLELKSFKEQTDEQRCEKIKNMPKAKNGMRAFKTHMFFPILPFRSHVKYIVILRDTREMAVSLYHFFHAHTSEWYKYWDFFHGKLPTLEDLVHGFETAPYAYPTIQSYWESRSLPNVLLLSYSNMIKNFPKELEKVQKFLDINLTESEKLIVDKNTSFEFMKKHENQFECTKIGPIIDGKYLQPLKRGGLIRNGKSDQGKSGLTPELIKKIEEMDEKKLSPECIKFMRTGELND